MAATKAELLKENALLRRRIAALERGAKEQSAESKASLAEAFEQQAATSEILRVISSSPTDVQPVLDAVAESAARLCEAEDVSILEEDGEVFRVVAFRGASQLRDFEGTSVRRGSVAGRAILDGQLIHVHDIREESAAEYPVSKAFAQHVGHRTMLATPLLHEGAPIGAILVRRTEVRPFSDNQIALLKTFAAQAVIAIENVRLFTELQEKSRALTEAHGQVTEALEQQTTTSEILRVISSSPTDVQPVFDAIVASAARLCDAAFSVVFRFDGELLQIAALNSFSPEETETFHRLWPRLPQRNSIVGRAFLEGRAVHVEDVLAEADYSDQRRELQRKVHYRTLLGIPMLREGVPIGVICVGRREVKPFSGKQIELVETFADQAVIAIENVRLFRELEARNHDLSASLDRQTAAAEILRVISRSQTDVQPVFDTIAENAVHLFRPWSVAVYRFDGELVHLAAVRGGLPGSEQYLREQGPRRPTREVMAARCIIDRAVVHIPDFETEHDVPAAAREIALLRGFRASLNVPMLKDGDPIGVISVSRVEAGAFSQAEIDLLQTFADQAVIAIANVRLFKELEARNRDLTESLEQQTATAEILRVISRSQTDVQPVFDTIVRSAVRLCDGLFSALFQFDGELIHQIAHHNFTPEALEAQHRVYPARPSRGLGAARAILDRAVVHIPDVEVDPEFQHQDVSRAIGWRSGLFVPMLREGAPIGVIMVARAEPGPFSDNEIKLLKTFADQAVIAVENVRLFKELEARNTELTETLARQIATGEVLRAISQAQTDAQPVFDIIVGSARRLCGAAYGQVQLYDGELIHLAALESANPEGDQAIRAVYPLRVGDGSAGGRAIGTRAVAQIPDLLDERAYAFKSVWEASGLRSLLAVPMLRDGEPIGTIGVGRVDPGPFPQTQLALLQTFADQAVIAIENVRLFKELEARTQELTRSVGELRALGEVGQAISSTLDLQTVLSTIVARATQLAGVDAGVIYEYDEQREVFEPRATERLETEIVQALIATPVRKGEGATGRLAEVPEPIQLPDVRDIAEQIPVRDVLIRAGYRALLAVPLVREDHLLGGLTVFRKTPGEFAPEIVYLLRTFATQSALAIQNARLFREIEEKSRELEAASRHKSEFLSNMSHELRTPLNAIIGFSEVLGDRLFGELTEKQEEYLKDIMESGQHLLSLINDILDLSKIEAGRMELELTEFDLPQAIDNALTLVRERAGRRGIALYQAVDERLAPIRADERKVKQVLLNLLSNALKFTPEGGRVEVRAGVVDGMAEVSVTDTGVGIAPEDQEAVFEEFRQVGTAAKKVEGTGLGLALSRKFVELHGGRIWVKSQVGVGSTFTFTLPVRRGG